jgi:hypothetical protein
MLNRSKEQNTVALRNKEQNVVALLESLTPLEMLHYENREKNRRAALLKIIAAYREAIADPALTAGQVEQAKAMYRYSPETGLNYIRAVVYYRKTGRSIAKIRFTSITNERKDEVVRLREDGATIKKIRDLTGIGWRSIRRILNESGVK